MGRGGHYQTYKSEEAVKLYMYRWLRVISLFAAIVAVYSTLQFDLGFAYHWGVTAMAVFCIWVHSELFYEEALQYLSRGLTSRTEEDESGA